MRTPTEEEEEEEKEKKRCRGATLDKMKRKDNA